MPHHLGQGRDCITNAALTQMRHRAFASTQLEAALGGVLAALVPTLSLNGSAPHKEALVGISNP